MSFNFPNPEVSAKFLRTLWTSTSLDCTKEMVSIYEELDDNHKNIILTTIQYFLPIKKIKKNFSAYFEQILKLKEINVEDLVYLMINYEIKKNNSSKEKNMCYLVIGEDDNSEKEDKISRGLENLMKTDKSPNNSNYYLQMIADILKVDKELLLYGKGYIKKINYNFIDSFNLTQNDFNNLIRQVYTCDKCSFKVCEKNGNPNIMEIYHKYYPDDIITNLAKKLKQDEENFYYKDFVILENTKTKESEPINIFESMYNDLKTSEKELIKYILIKFQFGDIPIELNY